MPRAISFSPMMTWSAPCRCEIVHLGVGMGARDDADRRVELPWHACTMAPASKPFGMATISVLRRRDVGRRQHLRQHGVADDRLDAAAARAARCASSSSSMTTKRHAALLQARRRRCCRRGRSRPGRCGRRGRSLLARGRRAASGCVAGCRRAPSRSAARNSSGLSRIERMAPVTMRSRPSCGSRPTSTPSAARMKENSPICARLAAISAAVPLGWPNARTISEGGDRLADHDDERASRRRRAARSSRIAGIEQHADRDEEEHREGVAQRQRFLRRPMAELRFGEHHAGEEGAERERDVEELRRAVGDAEPDGEHAEPEQLARAGMGDVVQDPRDHPPADDQHQDDEERDLGERDAERHEDVARSASADAAAGSAVGRRVEQRADRRQQRPAPAPSRCPRRSASRRRCGRDRSARAAAPAARASSTTVLATDSARPKTSPPPADQPSQHGEPPAEQRRDGDLRDGAGNGDGADRKQVLQREMHADAEHQQDDADLGELAGRATGRRRSPA